MLERCAAQNIGFEPLVWESIGGMTPETSSILDSLCRVTDGRMGIKLGTTRGKLSARISVDLQRGFHAACALQRTAALMVLLRSFAPLIDYCYCDHKGVSSSDFGF